SYALNQIAEYKVVDFRMPPGRMFEVMLFLGAPAAVSRLVKRDFTVPALFVAWAHLALTAQRNIPFFMMVIAAPVALWLEEMVAAFRGFAPPAEILSTGAGGEARIRRFPQFSVVGMVLILALLRAPGSPPKFRAQYDAEVYPLGAIEAVRQMGASTRMVTTD